MYEEGGVGLPSSTIDDNLPHSKVMAGRKCESGRTFNILVCLFYLLPPTGMSSPSAEMRMISILRVTPILFKLNKNVLGGRAIIDDLAQSEF